MLEYLMFYIIGDVSVVRNVILEFAITGFLSYIVTFIVNIYLKLKQHHIFVSEFDNNFTNFKKDINTKLLDLEQLISHKTDVLDVKINSVQDQMENGEKNIENVQKTMFSINDTVMKILSQ